VNVVRLLVLGILKQRRRAHGYAIRRELLSWRVETWTNVKPGSIYHAIRQLAKEGMLKALGTEESSAGPGRDLYEITRAGTREFTALLEAALASFALEELGSGVAFMQELPRGRVLEILRDQHRRATENRRHLERLIPTFPDRDRPPHTPDLLSLWSGYLAATAQWTAALIKRLEAGDYLMAGERSPAR